MRNRNVNELCDGGQVEEYEYHEVASELSHNRCQDPLQAYIGESY